MSVTTSNGPDSADAMASVVRKREARASGSASGMSALQALRGLTFETPRLLSASEIELLRQAKAEIAARVEELSGVSLVREEASSAAV